MESLMSSMSLVFFFFFGFSPFRFDQAVFLLSKGVRTIVVRKKEKKNKNSVSRISSAKVPRKHGRPQYQLLPQTQMIRRTAGVSAIDARSINQPTRSTSAVSKQIRNVVDLRMKKGHERESPIDR